MSNVSIVGAKPQSAEPSVNTPSPPKNTFRRPTRSAVRPATMSNDAKAIV